MPARPLTFSQRQGLTPVPEAIQLESLDERLRVDLWNITFRRLFRVGCNPYPYMLGAIWWQHFGQLSETYDAQEWRLAALIKTTMLEGAWHEVYDLLEYIASQTPDHDQSFVDLLNAVLAFNRAGYRIVGGQVVEITDETELRAIRDTAAQPAGSPTRQHIEQALSLFADRDNPQYANSIKESISAVESAAREFSGKSSATLGEALDLIAKQANASIHPALLKGWKGIYGFTSDSGGIRHADYPGSVPATQELAHYFLITCSAMVNYLTSLKANP
ncbi:MULTISPECIES: AbiJ-NTD4 domain-containing protein [unclassified Mycobacterium]|uniref:AbiJ-NTD4 domain-containing protein n=1 Tax=unclassified Mycobacterium TaxID=2642494 RepID=UPI0029C853FF|nr:MULTISPECIES: hypothetical protein [unclassified Mycobacterium]